MGRIWGVYRVTPRGLQYVPRSATTNEKLAMDIARDLTDGIVVMPDGRTKQVRARPHVHREINQSRGG